MSRYWVVTGETRKKILEADKKRQEIVKQISGFIKSHGADSVGISNDSLTLSAAFGFKQNPDPSLWKEVKGSKGFYLPKLTSKAGKEIDKKLRDLCRSVPTGETIGKIIDMPIFSGMYWQTPGYTVIDSKKVFVKTNNDYEPPASLVKDIKRISDVEFEKATKV
jgi:hypothetical protein